MKNVVLIGMMGAGKTTIGKLLTSKIKGFSFVDIDEKIVKKAKMSIPEIFDKFGEVCFRELEENTIADTLQKEKQVIAIGGGAFEDKINRDLMLEKSIVVYLKNNVEILYARVQDDKNRPLRRSKESFKKLFEIRKKNYQKAQLSINTCSKSPDEVVELILEGLKKYE